MLLVFLCVPTQLTSKLNLLYLIHQHVAPCDHWCGLPRKKCRIYICFIYRVKTNHIHGVLQLKNHVIVIQIPILCSNTSVVYNANKRRLLKWHILWWSQEENLQPRYMRKLCFFLYQLINYKSYFEMSTPNQNSLLCNLINICPDTSLFGLIVCLPSIPKKCVLSWDEWNIASSWPKWILRYDPR